MDFKDLSATSVKREKMAFYAVEDLLFQLIFVLNKYWEPLESGDLGLLRSLYLDNMYLLEQEATFEDENGIFNGTIQGISEVGLLTIRKIVNGETILRNYDLKEVRFILKSVL
jgi:biotin-(acetyl-CoA carboxylase) ligase